MSAQAIRIEKIQDTQMSFGEVVGKLARVKVKTQEQNRLTVTSLFAGVGGIDLAFQNAGFEIEVAKKLKTKLIIATDTHKKPYGLMLLLEIA